MKDMEILRNNKKLLKINIITCKICGYQTTSYPIYFIDVKTNKSKNKKYCPRIFVCDGCYSRLKKYKGQTKIQIIKRLKNENR